MKITNVAIDHKTSIFVLLALVLFGGLISYIGLPLESFPQIEQPMVYVATPYVGVAPEDMETLVVQPIEEKLTEISEIKLLTSTATEGYASVIAEFDPTISIEEAVRKTREKVDLAKPDLPTDMEDPIVQEVNLDEIPIIMISITGELPLLELKEIAENISDDIKEVNGILDVDITGGLEREVKVDINPTRLQYYNIGIEDVNNAIRDENLTIPGGSTESSDLKWTVRVPGEFESIDELKNIVVKAKDGHPVYLYDLADVYLGYEQQESYSRLNKQASVTLAVKKRSGENIISLIAAAKEIVEEHSESFPPGVNYTYINDFSIYIEVMVSDLENNIIAGFLLVVFVLYFFMGGRNGFLVGIAIPLSMLTSFIVISMIGYTLNMMVLFSLILALGMLVDNAVVIIENIYRHHEEGKPIIQAAKDGTAEVGIAVIVSTATTLMAFLPLIFWPGIEGKFMAILPMTLIITLSCSLVVALLFNPVIASSFLKLDEQIKNLPGDRFLRRFLPRYENMLRWSLSHRARVLLLTFGTFIGMGYIFSNFNHGIEYFPNSEPRQIFVQTEAPLGTRLETSDQIIREIETRLGETTDLRNMVADVGKSNDMGAMMGFGQSQGTAHKSQVTLDLFEKVDREQNSFLTLEQVQEALLGIPGAEITYVAVTDGPPLKEALSIQLRGENFGVLSELSEEIQGMIADVEGISKLQDNYDRGKPELQIRIDREKAALFGLNTAKIANSIRTAVNGTEVSEYRFGQEEYDITVRFADEYRKSYTNLLDLTVFHEGVHYPLANFASVEMATGLANISHVDRDRVVSITADAVGRSSSELVAEVKERLANYTMPQGYSMTFAGQDEQQAESVNFLMNAFLITIGLIFLLLVTEFNSLALPFVILITVLLSMFGVMFGLLVTGRPLGVVMTGIGIISLAGVVVNNAIVLIDYIQKLRARGLSKLEAIVEGGKTRLRPVILTAITTILGLIPLTVGINIDFIGLLQLDFSNFIQFGADSSQWWSGMGIAVIFGLFFATVLTLIVVPVCYDLMSKRQTVEVSETEEENTRSVERDSERDVDFGGEIEPANA